MHIALKAALALTAVIGVGVAIHHDAFADSPAPVVVQELGGVVIPTALEAHIRALARAHAPQGADPAAAELHAMLMIKAHLAQVAKDPAMTAEANQVMAAAVAGDTEALKHVEQMLIAIMSGAHP